MDRFKIMTKSYLFLCFNLLILISPSQSRYLRRRCDDGNYTANSTYQTNLDSIVSSLASAIAATPSGFLNQSAGQTPDKVNALALCRGDVQLDTCSRCINDSYDRAREFCPNRQGATIWYDDCMLRFSSGTIFNVLDTRGGAIVRLDNIPNAEELYRLMRPLMDRLKDEASRGDRLKRKFAYGDTPGPRFSRIYGLMQCTPDLTEDECYRCLEIAANSILSYNSSAVTVLYPSCNFRYANSRFYNETVVLAPPPTEAVRPPPMSPPPPPPSKSSNTTFIIIAVISTVSFVTLIAIFTCVVKKRKRKLELRPIQNFNHEHGNIDEISTAKSLNYSFGVIRAATDNFSHNNKLGEGGVGVVYKGDE